MDEELLKRNYCSRLYYTTLLHCRETLQIQSTSKDSHNDIINELTSLYKLYMLSLKELRRKADYELSTFSEPYKLKGKYENVQRLQVIAEDILKQNISSLKNDDT